jgi:hypothetical protein
MRRSLDDAPHLAVAAAEAGVNKVVEKGAAWKHSFKPSASSSRTAIPLSLPARKVPVLSASLF